MSGRWLTIGIVSTCMTVALVALWLRSRDTAKIRDFWGADVAHLIQYAPSVERKSQGQWQDISAAPGLVHLRATLVEDRYFHWPWRTLESREIEELWEQLEQVRFSTGTKSLTIGLDFTSGAVVFLDSKRSAELIPTSRDAIASYMKAIQ